jgi:hypothetical protein
VLCSNRLDPARRGIQRVTAIAAVVGEAELGPGDQVDGDVLLQQRDIGMGLDPGLEGGLHRAAGCIVDMDHAAVAVAALGRQVVAGIARRITGEGHPLADQPFDTGAAALDHVAGDRVVAQAGAGDLGVANMALRGVVAGKHGGDAALGPAAGAVEQLLFGDHPDLPLSGEMEGERQAGQPAAYDQDIETSGHFESGKVRILA